MRTLYIECNMGVAGDMLMGALLELVEEKEQFIEKMNHLGIPKVQIASSQSVKCRICGTHVSVEIDGEKEDIGHHHEHNHNHNEHVHHNGHDHHHEHASMEAIEAIIDTMDIAGHIKKNIKGIYHLIAEAESQVHGKPITEVHLHEVGAMDAIADITGCCMLMDEIHPERIVVSPIVTGFGHVHCAHGIMPVPAPATALILKGIPNKSGSIEGELCTPTGAAIVKYFADEFAYHPQMVTDKDFPSANCVRVLLGETREHSEKVMEFCSNIDDMTPEEIGYATEVLLKNGAIDVYTTSIGMKKSRPGIMLTVMCKMQDKDKIAKLIFKHTTTIGLRQYVCERMTLNRRIKDVDTQFGKVSMKKSEGYGVEREKPEYEDMKRIADDMGMSIMEIKKKLNGE